jgi:shikimate kinase
MKNIVLVGFMGTGKTAVGRLLSTALGMEYISTDDLIEEKAGKKIAQIFTDEGEPVFRVMEHDISKELGDRDGLIIDTGGGLVLNSLNTFELRKNGCLVCLWASPEVIYDRVKKHSHRPLLNVPNPLKEITALLDIRKPFYEASDYFVNTDNMSLEEVVEAISTWYQKQ